MCRLQNMDADLGREVVLQNAGFWTGFGVAGSQLCLSK